MNRAALWSAVPWHRFGQGGALQGDDLSEVI